MNMRDEIGSEDEREMKTAVIPLHYPNINTTY